MNHLNLLRKLAWSFHRTSGIDWEELFSESLVAYTHALQSHDENRSNLVTWVYVCVRNHLSTMLLSQRRMPESMGGEIDIDQQTDHQTPEDLLIFKEKLEGMSTNAKALCQMILQSPHEFIGANKILMRDGLYHKLKKRKTKTKTKNFTRTRWQTRPWTREMLWDCFREIRKNLNEK